MSSSSTSCGLSWLGYPQFLQKFATTRSFILVYGLLGTFQAMGFVYFVITLQTLEKRFKIPSQTTGKDLELWCLIVNAIESNLEITQIDSRLRSNSKWEWNIADTLISIVSLLWRPAEQASLYRVGRNLLCHLMLHLGASALHLWTWRRRVEINQRIHGLIQHFDCERELTFWCASRSCFCSILVGQLSSWQIVQEIQSIVFGGATRTRVQRWDRIDRSTRLDLHVAVRSRNRQHAVLRLGSNLSRRQHKEDKHAASTFLRLFAENFWTRCVRWCDGRILFISLFTFQRLDSCWVICRSKCTSIRRKLLWLVCKLVSFEFWQEFNRKLIF